MTRVLVTGANGFIGRHLILALQSLGLDITALVRDKGRFSFNNVKVVVGDISDESILNRAVENVDIIFHLAAKTHDHSEKKGSEQEYRSINVDGTKNLLQAASLSEVKHFIYFSSIKAMTEEAEGILDETFPAYPTTLYGRTKLEAERLVAEYGRTNGFKTTSLRLPLVYGPGNKGNIFKMIEAIDKGFFIPVGDGLSKRSMVYVENVVDAALSVVGRQEADGKVYIVCDRIDYSLKELYQTIAKALVRKPLPFSLPMNIARGIALAADLTGMIINKNLPFNSDALDKLTKSLRFSSSKIHREIGFAPKYDLYNTIDKTIKFYRIAKS